MPATFTEVSLACSASLPPEIFDVQMPPTVKSEILQPEKSESHP